MDFALSDLHPVNNYRLTQDAITSRTWLFGRPDWGVLGKHVQLLASGHVGGFDNASERRWELIDGRLAFLDAAGRRTVVFDQVFLTSSGMLVLQGAFRLAEGVTHVLQEREPLSRIAEGIGAVQVIPAHRVGRRRNLVVLRANEGSLHPTWQRDISDEDRNWDLCVSFYGKEENFPPQDFAEYHVLQNHDQKWPALHKLMYRGNPFWDYEYFLFPDDDLAMSWTDINLLFETGRRFGLHLAQPALTPTSYYGHRITMQNPKYRLRFTEFVEIMIPMFSRVGLEICAPTFACSSTGWGLDMIWPCLLGEQPSRIAIIDEVAVLHGRALGGRYDVALAKAEMDRLVGDYGCTSRARELGGVLA